MLYTSYFAKGSKGWKDNVIPVAICRYPPKGFNGVHYFKLAPSHKLLMEWKSDPRNDDYFGTKRKQYDDEVLSKLDPKEVMHELQRLWPYGPPIWEDKYHHVVLLCYEKPGDFCHRHFVAQWLTENDFKCEEV